MSGDVTLQAVKRISWLPDRDSIDNGNIIAGQDYHDVEFVGGAISNVVLTDVTVNGTETARTERVITASGNVTVASDDYIITMAKTVGQITTITLPASPTTSRSLIIKDDNGDAATYNITIDGNGKDIDGDSTLVLNVDFQSVEIVYNGTQWNVIGSHSFPTTIAAGSIVNADINAAAAIAHTKMAALTASRAVVTDGSGFAAAATTTATEIGYVNGVTSSIQTQLNGKQASGSYATLTGAETLTNKRINPRVTSTASSATPTPNADTDDEYIITALSAAAAFQVPSGTPVQGQAMVIRIKDNGTNRALTYNAIYRAIGITLPTSTTANKTIYLGMIYNATDTKWDVTGYVQEA